MEFGDEPVWVLTARGGDGSVLGQVILSAFDANVFRTVWYYRGARGYIKIVDSALDGLKKPAPTQELETTEEPDSLRRPERRTDAPNLPLDPSDPGTEEAEVRPVLPERQ